MLAASDGRKPDAVSYFLRAAEAAPEDYAPANSAYLIGRAKALWNTLGGSAEGLEALRGADRQPGDAQRWTVIGTPMPALPGQGFTGKTFFINVWASCVCT